MTTLENIENRISLIQKYMGILEQFTKIEKQELRDDTIKRGALERYLYLLTQAAIDLADAIIAFKNFRKPSSLSEAFSILRENELLDQNIERKMIGMVGFRNILAHEYTEIDYQIVFTVLDQGKEDIKVFVNLVAEDLGLNPPF